MGTVVVTLLAPDQDTLDIELPDQVSVQQLISALVSSLKFPEVSSSGTPVLYELARYVDGKLYGLRSSDTLESAGVLTGSYLVLTSTLTQLSGIQAAVSDAEVASLHCPSGRVIVLDNFGKHELTVGRYDARTGQTPDIELSAEPEGNTVSRQHVLLRKKGSQWLIVAVAQGNVTRVEDVPLSLHQARTLVSGERILLGGLRLVFEAS